MARGLKFSFSATDRSKTAFSGVQNNIRKTQGLQKSWNAGLNSNRRAVQQFGFQMTDFATQVAGGQSAMLAFTQQGGQMLQFFGPAGAIMAAFLAVFGSIIIAFQRSGAALSSLTPIMGVLADDFRAIGNVLRAVKEVMIDFANVVLNNMDRIIITTATVVGGFVAYKLVMLGSKIATYGLVASLRLLRTALIRTGIGALIIGAGELVYQFTRLVKGAGGFGNAMVLLGNLAIGVWNRISAGASVLAVAVQLAWNDIKHAWIVMTGDMKIAWGSFMDFVADSNIGDMMNMDGGNVEAAMRGNAASIRENTTALGPLLTKLQAAEKVIRAPVEGLKELRDAMSAANDEGKRIDIRDWFGGGGDDDKDGGGSKKKDLAEKLSEQAKKVKDVFEGMSKSISGALSTAFGQLRDRTKSIKDVAVDMLTTVLNKLTDTMLNPLWDQIGNQLSGLLIGTPTAGGSFGGGILSGIFSGIFGGAKSNAGGGDTGKGARQGGLDGRGGFMTMVHPNERIDDNTRHQNSGGGNGPVEVHIHENAGGEKTNVQQSDGRIDIFLRNMVRDTIADGGADKAMSGRFGVRPQAVGG